MNDDICDTWSPVMYDLDYQHRRVCDEVYFEHFGFDHLTPNLVRLPWGRPPTVATPSFFDPSSWWNNVSLANTTQDGV